MIVLKIYVLLTQYFCKLAIIMLFSLFNMYIPTRKRNFETGEPKNLKFVSNVDRRPAMGSPMCEYQ